MIKILIIEDHKILIEGIKELLKNEVGCVIAYEAYNGSDGLKKINSMDDIDIVLLDINLPDITGIEVCKQIKSLKSQLPILTLTMHSSASYLREMINAGANGYILKDTTKDELVTAIRTVIEGELFLSPQVKKLVHNDITQINLKGLSNDEVPQLTSRESEILKYILQEFKTSEIAEKLKISHHTVISHRKNLLKKFDARNTAGIVKKAFENNMIINLLE